MGLEVIMLSEISHIPIASTARHSYVESKIVTLVEVETRVLMTKCWRT